MSNRESYKRAFQPLHASKRFVLEEIEMNNRKTRLNFSRGLAVAMLAAVLLIGSLSAAYAADLGGIRRSIQIWVFGKAKDATVAFYTGDGAEIEHGDDGEATPAHADYIITWTDDDGEEHQISGGGVALERDGTERPLTVEEHMEHINSISAVEQVAVTEDGRVMLYWYDQVVDITDKFVDGACRLTLTHKDETMFFTVIDAGDGAYNVSCASDGYVD